VWNGGGRYDFVDLRDEAFPRLSVSRIVLQMIAASANTDDACLYSGPGMIFKFVTAGSIIAVWIGGFACTSHTVRLCATWIAEPHRALRNIILQRGAVLSVTQRLALSGSIFNVASSRVVIALDPAAIPFVGHWVRVGVRYAPVLRLPDNVFPVQFAEPLAVEGLGACVRT
jgi:hypothetical protein